ncbi:sensor histidine kinase [Methanosphaerula subterraneus]|uniref:sensor histidine kinase n=1 Tax=Methanosphaerula subterraneus TaxID=3350244 RepID=UPI003F82C100
MVGEGMSSVDEPASGGLSLPLLLGLFALLGISLVSLWNYLLFHAIVEVFTAVIAGMIAVLTWNTRRYQDTPYFLIAGVGFLGIGVIGLLHMLAFQGMQIFLVAGSNLATQLWIAESYLLACSLVAAGLLINRRVKAQSLLLVYGVIVAALLASILLVPIFPACYIDGIGLTPFKVVSEYLIMLLLVLAIVLLVHRRTRFDQKVWRLLVIGIVLVILGELSFTLYVEVTSFFNLLGHLFRVLAFALFYKAIIETGMNQPFRLLFRDLTVREQELREAREYLEALITYANGPILVWDSSHRITRFNHALEEITGLAAADMIGRDITSLFSGTGDDPGMTPNSVPVPGQRWEGVELQVRHLDGTVRTVLWNSATVYREDQTTIAATIAQGLDITERKQAEEARATYAEELARSNQDLEQFAYVASHDLQEPLRMVASYTQLLARRYRGKLDQDADQYIAYASEGAERMQMLIQDLLEFSRVNAKGKPFTVTDTARVVEQVLEDLRVSIDERHAIVTCDPLPLVLADEQQIRQVFLNLIGNAIKFSEEAPNVHLGAVRQGDDWVFSVEDGGIGIDPEFFDRIFVIFQRLHTREQYQGTGIGLAIVKRIIERHHGSIQVRSAPGEGTTFFFTLPGVPDAP